MDNLISRQQAIDVIETGRLTKLIDVEIAVNGLKNLPSVQPKARYVKDDIGADVYTTCNVQPERAIPLSWIEGYIERLCNTHGIYSALRVSIIDTMIDEWNKAQKGVKRETD